MIFFHIFVRPQLIRSLLVGICLFALPAIAEAALVEIENPRIKASIPGAANSVAYATIVNRSDKKIVLVGVSVDGVARAGLHGHSHDNGVMRMRPVDSIEIDAGSTLALKPGGYHLMLFSPTQPLQTGDSKKIIFEFAGGAQIDALAPVFRD